MTERIPMSVQDQQQPLNLNIDNWLYQALETIAKLEQQSIPQAAQNLIEEGLRRRSSDHAITDDPSAADLGLLCATGGAFEWLNDEPDLYDDTCGEPV